VSEAITLSEQTVNQIVECLAARIHQDGLTDAILTRDEAKTYVKRSSDRAFGRWCKKWSVRSISHGRYSRSQLDLALSREARKRR
jgi:hypothetical protein